MGVSHTYQWWRVADALCKYSSAGKALQGRAVRAQRVSTYGGP